MAVLGELKLMPPRTAMKVNCLVMRHLHFGSVRGDLLERCTGPGGSHIQHQTPAPPTKQQPYHPSDTSAHGQAAASSGGDTEVA